jgi:hypothetical protein
LKLKAPQHLGEDRCGSTVVDDILDVIGPGSVVRAFDRVPDRGPPKVGDVYELTGSCPAHSIGDVALNVRLLRQLLTEAPSQPAHDVAVHIRFAHAGLHEVDSRLRSVFPVDADVVQRLSEIVVALAVGIAVQTDMSRSERPERAPCTTVVLATTV